MGLFDYLKPLYLKTHESPDNNAKCLFGAVVSKYAAKHPGGHRLIESGGFVGDDAATMLFLSYHLTKDFDKINQIADSHGFTGISKIKRPAFHRELDAIYSAVVSEHRVHFTIYRIYCVLVTLLFVCSLCIHCFSSTINLYNDLLIVLAWNSYSFAVFHTRV